MRNRCAIRTKERPRNSSQRGWQSTSASSSFLARSLARLLQTSTRIGTSAFVRAHPLQLEQGLTNDAAIANVSNDTLRLVPARLTALNGLWESLKPVPKVVAGDFVAVSD